MLPLTDSLGSCTLSQLTALIGKEAIRQSLQRYPHELEAIVLTGSLARDEGTVVRDEEGCRMLGDADFFLVYRSGCRLPSPPAIEQLTYLIEEALSQQGLSARVGLAAVHPSYFENLPRHVSVYELRACGQVIWGRGDVLSRIPSFSAAEISREDAWRMLANRITEQLELLAVFGEQPDTAMEAILYRTVKLYLDIATSYLVFAGDYRPTYREREQVLRRMAEGTSQPDSPFPLQPFAEDVSACTRMKVETRSGDFSGDGATLRMQAVARYAQLLWEWELRKLTGEADEFSSSELMHRWMEKQPAAVRLRGWGSLIRRSGWLWSWRQWPRWIRLGCQASPRYWVYSVATELFFAMPWLVSSSAGGLKKEIDWKALSRRLPSLGRARPQGGARPWLWLAEEAAANYHRFLEKTCA